MQFDPGNNVVKLCLQGMEKQEKRKSEEARKIFLQALSEGANDFERFLASYFISKNEEDARKKLPWLQQTVDLAIKIDEHAVKAAFPGLYADMAECYAELGDVNNAGIYNELARSTNEQPSDPGPFYHGTRADLKPGDLLTPGFNSNYYSELVMNHIYFTALENGAGLAAALAKGEGRERVYMVEPAGPFENDPNVTNKKFPGNPTRSYRTQAPLKITGELNQWTKPAPEVLQKWRERLANGNSGEIIN